MAGSVEEPTNQAYDTAKEEEGGEDLGGDELGGEDLGLGGEEEEGGEEELDLEL